MPIANNEKIARARREYAKRWRRAHKERVAEYNRRFYRKLYDKLESEQGLKPENKTE